MGDHVTMTRAQQATLRGGLPRPRRTATSAVLVLHGGQEHNLQPTAATQLSYLRMLDMYVGLRRHSSGAAVYLLRHRVRGWNPDPAGGSEPDPVTDARWALDRITDRHGDVPVALLGHSMGGRTAFAVADDRRVVGVCGLAPWLPEGEPVVEPRDDQRFVIAHGTADRTTSPDLSLRYAEKLRASGAAVARFELAGGRHDLLSRPVLWHRLAVAVPLGLAGDAALPRAVVDAFKGVGSDGLRVPLDDVRSP
jgi:pimeloyl-ACP methyl ester carboxylesterase